MTDTQTQPLQVQIVWPPCPASFPDPAALADHFSSPHRVLCRLCTTCSQLTQLGIWKRGDYNTTVSRMCNRIHQSSTSQLLARHTRTLNNWGDNSRDCRTRNSPTRYRSTSGDHSSAGQELLTTGQRTHCPTLNTFNPRCPTLLSSLSLSAVQSGTVDSGWLTHKGLCNREEGHTFTDMGQCLLAPAPLQARAPRIVHLWLQSQLADTRALCRLH